MKDYNYKVFTTKLTEPITQDDWFHARNVLLATNTCQTSEQQAKQLVNELASNNPNIVRVTFVPSYKNSNDKFFTFEVDKVKSDLNQDKLTDAYAHAHAHAFAHGYDDTHAFAHAFAHAFTHTHSYDDAHTHSYDDAHAHAHAFAHARNYDDAHAHNFAHDFAHTFVHADSYDDAHDFAHTFAFARDYDDTTGCYDDAFAFAYAYAFAHTDAHTDAHTHDDAQKISALVTLTIEELETIKLSIGHNPILFQTKNRYDHWEELGLIDLGFARYLTTDLFDTFYDKLSTPPSPPIYAQSGNFCEYCYSTNDLSLYRQDYDSEHMKVACDLDATDSDKAYGIVAKLVSSQT